MPKFEVAIFNQRVRDLMKMGGRHRHLEDNWADIHYIEVDASTSKVAKRKILERHSNKKGFVIVSIESVN